MTVAGDTALSGGEYDLAVVGAGVGGLTAALSASLLGRKVLLIEKSPFVGGTSARSSGTVWIPDNPYQRQQGFSGDAEAARSYLEALVGERAGRPLREAFLRAGPEMLSFLNTQAGIAFRPYPVQPDYRQELPGAALGWRALEPLPFDGRRLTRHFAEVGWPLPELMLFGGMMITRGEAARLLTFTKRWDGLRLATGMALRYGLDRLRYPRGTRLVLGNALVARLYWNLLKRKVPVLLNADPRELILEKGRVIGLRLRQGGIEHGGIEFGDIGRPARERVIHTTGGVVLAGGGFPASSAWRQRHLPAPTPDYTPAFEGCRGETLELALAAGGVLGKSGEDNAFWFPSSIARRRDGSTAVYPHIVLDRAKPGLVAVDAAGRRFVNEGVSYHEFTRAMYRAHRQTPSIPAWLVCDRNFLWQYGLGMVRPHARRLGRFLESGYLHRASSLRGLAGAIGVAADGLEQTVGRVNGFARTGQDTDFGKGDSPYERAYGDPAHTPNPCLGPIERPPFYAVAVLPTPLGTSLGLLTDEKARVLNERGQPIPGLYACGNDQHSAFGGEYPGAGAQLGVAMVFGYLAAKNIGG